MTTAETISPNVAANNVTNTVEKLQKRRPETVSRQLVPERGNDWRRRSKIQQHFWSTEASYKFSKTINLAIANRLRVGSGHTVTTTNFPRG